MVLTGDDDVLHARVLRDLDPLVCVKLHWVELVNKPAVLIDRYLSGGSDPLSV